MKGECGQLDSKLNVPDSVDGASQSWVRYSGSFMHVYERWFGWLKCYSTCNAGAAFHVYQLGHSFAPCTASIHAVVPTGDCCLNYCLIDSCQIQHFHLHNWLIKPAFPIQALSAFQLMCILMVVHQIFALIMQTRLYHSWWKFNPHTPFLSDFISVLCVSGKHSFIPATHCWVAPAQNKTPCCMFCRLSCNLSSHVSSFICGTWETNRLSQ